MKVKQGVQSSHEGKTGYPVFNLAFSAIAKAYDSPADGPMAVMPNEPDPGKSWYIEGFASTQDIDLSRYADPEIQPSGMRLSETALQDLVDWTKDLSTVFKNHDLEDEIGAIVEAEVRQGKMWVKILISKTVPLIWQRILEKVLNKFSVQFIPQAWHFEQDPLTGKPVMVVDRAVGLETSVVGLPMNFKADINAAYAASFLKSFQKTSGTGEPMNREQLVEQIKAHLAQLGDPVVDAEMATEIKAQVATFYQALKALDASVPDPLAGTADEWALAMVAPPKPADATVLPDAAAEAAAATAVTAAAAVAEATATHTPGPTEGAAAAVADAINSATDGSGPIVLSAEVKQELVAMGVGVTRVLGSISRGTIPLSAVADMAYLEQSLSDSGLSEKTRAKTINMLVDMFKMVAESTAAEKKAATPAEFGAIAKSFEAQSQNLLNQFAAAVEASKAILEENKKYVAEAAALNKQNKDLLDAVEKKSLEIKNITVSGPNAQGATPPAAPAKIDLNDQESRLRAWQASGTPISTGR